MEPWVGWPLQTRSPPHPLEVCGANSQRPRPLQRFEALLRPSSIRARATAGPRAEAGAGAPSSRLFPLGRHCAGFKVWRFGGSWVLRRCMESMLSDGWAGFVQMPKPRRSLSFAAEIGEVHTYMHAYVHSVYIMEICKVCCVCRKFSLYTITSAAYIHIYI